MNLQECYLRRDRVGSDVYQAQQYTGPECLKHDHGFLTLLKLWTNTADPDALISLDNGERLLFNDGMGPRVLAAGDWLVNTSGERRPAIVEHTYFADSYVPVVDKLDSVPSALSRVNAVGNKVYHGPVDVQSFVAKLRAEQRLTDGCLDALLKSDRLYDPEVSAQIYPIQRGIAREVHEELAVCVPHTAPITIVLKGLVPAPADIAMGEEAVIERCQALNRDGSLTDSLLKVVQSLPHLQHVDVMLTVLPQNIQISAGAFETLELPLVITQNRPYDSVDQMFDRFVQLMKVKHSEMDPIKLDHRTLMTALSETLMDDSDEDQFIKIGIYAMGLQEVGGFTVGQLVHANELPDAPGLVDLGNEFEGGKE